jgi:hypothetical protein
VGGGDVFDARREIIVNPRRAATIANHLLKGTCGKCPFVQRDPADAQWIVEILVGAGTVAIEGHCEAVDAKLGHLCSFPICLHTFCHCLNRKRHFRTQDLLLDLCSRC